ncbi:C2H2-type zinc finger protein [Aquimarina megaterium]|uniref:C2H2-type zinc finger protein n=1 Tax=Aquimarina megaterium TaxID=1443666 RepID=UPI00126983E2|nr:C2H2-type zinc finger protein [Aquimarina megaterium]
MFAENSHFENPWFSWCYAIGVDLAILIFGLSGWIKASLFYLFVMIAHNLLYVFMPVSDLSGILLSTIQAITVYSLCHLFIENVNINGLNGIANIPKEIIKIHKAMNAGVRFQPQPFICPECKESFATSKQLNGHISGHKTRGEWNPESYGEWELENESRSEILF